ncbi:retrovirus-related pol polyprotein from transposon TNT 1-94 [Tanacetum coccineum]
MDKNAKDFLKLVEKKFRSADKALAGTLMAELTTMKFDRSKSMQKHVLDMTNTAARLKTLDKWNIDELSIKLIQKEARLKKQRVHSVNLVNQGVNKKLTPKAKNFKKKQHGTTSKVDNAKKKEQMDNKCKFCRKEGHFQKDFPKRKAWFEKKVKIIRSDRGGEYYGKYDESKQCPGPFAKFLKSHGICAQYTMPGMPQQNAEARVYSPQEKKLDSQTVSGYFIGYPEKSKGYRFYCPNHSSRIVETGKAKFLENGKVSGSVENQVVDINEIMDGDPSSMNVHKSTTTPNVVLVFQNQEQHLNIEQTPHEENNLPTQTSKPVGIALNKL